MFRCFCQLLENPSIRVTIVREDEVMVGNVEGDYQGTFARRMNEEHFTLQPAQSVVENDFEKQAIVNALELSENIDSDRLYHAMLEVLIWPQRPSRIRLEV